MNDVSALSTLKVRALSVMTRERVRPWLDAGVHYALLLAAVAVAILTAHQDTWDLGIRNYSPVLPLGIIAVFAVSSELAAKMVPAGTFSLSGSLLGIVVAAVLGGGGPAAAVGVLVLVVGWFTYREEWYKLRHNLVNFVWYALAAGLFFHAAEAWVFQPAQLAWHGTHPPAAYGESGYYLLVFATFIVALATNVVLITPYLAFLTRTSLLSNLPPLRPMLPAQSASAVLTMLAVYMTNKYSITGLVLFGLVLIVFQYLISELLVSMRRGEELQVLATTDELSGLANRKHFGDLLEKEIATATASGESFGVLLLDLDRFKDINDTLGHEYGDDLLSQLGPRLVERLGEKTLIARFGGDEFAILPEERIGSIDEISAIADRVINAIKEPITIGSVTLSVDSSVGAVRFPADGRDVHTLLRRADTAMYAAKEHRDGYRIYNPQLERSTAQLHLLEDFLRALEEDQLVLVYHPIIDLVQRRVSGAEALVRWEHPERGLLPPIEFIELVEQTGLIGALTETVLDKAIAECARWRADGQDLSVGVNLSMRNLLDPQLPDLVKRKLKQHRVPPEALKLEITERMIMSDPDRAVRTVRKLGALGVKIAVDDFGTGHSSLANLRLLPIDELKIDRSFVTPMLTDQSDMVIVRSTIDLGHALGLKVIAEGVENAETLSALEDLGCDRAQGHFMSTPMPPSKFPGWSRSFEDGYRSAA